MRGNGCVNLTEVIISQCVHTLNHHIVHLKKIITVKTINIQNKYQESKGSSLYSSIDKIKVFPHIQFCVQALLSAYSNILSNI